MKNLSKNSRQNVSERRDLTADISPVSAKPERRKRPDRRLGGMNVEVVDMSDTAIMSIIHDYKSDR